MWRRLRRRGGGERDSQLTGYFITVWFTDGNARTGEFLAIIQVNYVEVAKLLVYKNCCNLAPLFRYHFHIIALELARYDLSSYFNRFKVIETQLRNQTVNRKVWVPLRISSGWVTNI